MNNGDYCSIKISKIERSNIRMEHPRVKEDINDRIVYDCSDKDYWNGVLNIT